MTWDSILVAAVASELEDVLLHARLRAVQLDREARRALLFFREATLALDLHPERGALALTRPGEPLPGARPLPCRVERVWAPPDDRVILLETRRVRGRRAPWLLAVELMTNQWNLALAEGEDRVVRATLREREGERPVRVGAPWLPPPPSQREGREGDLPLARWMELLEGVEPGRRRGTLLSRVAWTSTLNARALLGEAALEDGPAGRAALERGHTLWKRLAAAPSSPDPVLLALPAGPQPYPLPLPGADASPTATVLVALALAARGAGPGDGAPLVPSTWTAAAEARVEHARRRLGSLARRLASQPDPAALRGVGDLILARYGEVPAGAARATLPGFDGEAVEVALDPALQPHENAASYYDRAARAERARERLPRLIAEAEGALRGAESLLERVEGGQLAPHEAEALLPELVAGGAPGRRPGTALPYRRYRSSGGLEIRVGRSSKANDLLTFQHARPDDVWLHARHAAGAHVILRWEGEGSPPARDLAEAAVLAALHSRARSSGSVPVDWTRRKYVRKPRRAAPGTVIPERVATLFVDPDPAVEVRLSGGGEGIEQD